MAGYTLLGRKIADGFKTIVDSHCIILHKWLG
jgi:hypothetical protein